MKTIKKYAVFVFLFPFLTQVLLAQGVNLEQKQLEALAKETIGLSPGKLIELEALEIRAKIHEPTIIYILDRPKLEIDFKENEVHFSPRISDPILLNRF